MTKRVTSHIEEYADRPLSHGRSLRSRMIFGFTVIKIEKDRGTWTVEGRSAIHTIKKVRAPTLIVATGLASEPNMPSIPDMDKFEGLILHEEFSVDLPFFPRPLYRMLLSLETRSRLLIWWTCQSRLGKPCDGSSARLQTIMGLIGALMKKIGERNPPRSRFHELPLP